MSDINEERLARIAAHESAGWNSTPTKVVWAVTPDLTGSFDEVYFQEMEDAIEYIQDNLGEKISDYTDEELGTDGFNLRLWRKFISQEQYDAIFDRGEWIEPTEGTEVKP